MQSWNSTSPEFKARIIGKLLGDGGITKQEGRKPRFKITHAASDFEWINFCYHKLKNDIPINPPVYKKVIDDRLVKGYSEAYQLQSKTSDVITYLYKMWYPNGVKIIPFTLLDKHFTLESLAWWYMDDGHLKMERGIPKKIILSTESFTDIEIIKLIDFIASKYKLKFSIDGQRRIILYDQFQIRYFLHLIYPYLHHSMYRKFIHKSSLYKAISAKRTTIYLPKEIRISKPTKEINDALYKLTFIINEFKQGNFYSKYHDLIFRDHNKFGKKSYQIIINQENLANLLFLKQNTGLTSGQLTEVSIYNYSKLKLT